MHFLSILQVLFENYFVCTKILIKIFCFCKSVQKLRISYSFLCVGSFFFCIFHVDMSKVWHKIQRYEKEDLFANFFFFPPDFFCTFTLLHLIHYNSYYTLKTAHHNKIFTCTIHYKYS